MLKSTKFKIGKIAKSRDQRFEFNLYLEIETFYPDYKRNKFETWFLSNQLRTHAPQTKRKITNVTNSNNNNIPKLNYINDSSLSTKTNDFLCNGRVPSIYLPSNNSSRSTGHKRNLTDMIQAIAIMTPFVSAIILPTVTHEKCNVEVVC